MVLSLALWCLSMAHAGDVRGIVLDASGAPMEVEVQVAEVSVRTDRWGAFSLTVDDGWAPVRIGGDAVGDVNVGPIPAEVIATHDGSQWHVTLEAPLAPEVTMSAVIGEVSGQVTDETGEPVAGIRVLVRGATHEAVTNAAGRYVLALPEGAWDLTFLGSGYATVGEPGVQIGETHDITVVQAGLALEAFTVTAPAVSGGTADLLAERQASATVGDAIGAEQMARSGDTTAASALQRVTGLTVVGGKYVYVRGLGERYAATLLDGTSLPSPEPERRVVPLDLFPTGMLERVVVQKSYSPDMPGEFGGGMVSLDTRRVPQTPFFQASLSTGGDSIGTFQRGLGYASGPTDFLGVDGGWRALPDNVATASNSSPLEEGDRFSDRGYSAEKLEEYGKSMANRWDLSDRFLLPDMGLTASGGTAVDTPLGTLGVLAGGTWSHAWNHDVTNRQYIIVGGEDDIEVAHNYDFTTTTRDVRLGGLLSVTLKNDRVTWSLTSLVARATDDEARIYEGLNRDVGGDIRVSRMRYVERQLWTNKLGAEHRVSDATTVSWRYALSRATRIEPDRRELRYDNELGTDVWRLSDRPEGNQRVFSGLADWGHDLGGSVAVEVGDVTLSGGLQAVLKSRSVDTRRFKFLHKGPGSRDQDLLAQNAETIFAAENIGSDAFQFEEITRATDNYTASQRLGAAYLMANADLSTGTRILMGARIESSQQVVETFALFDPDPSPIRAELSTVDLLPALTVTQSLPGDTVQIRAGYGRTVNRPDFRELSPATFNDVTGGRQTFGNADLDRARIDHLDLRAEWYPTEGESFSIGGFAKRFIDPIEQVVVVSAQHSVTYDNVDGANNVGIELEGRKNFGMISPAMESVTLSGNLALIRSRVTLGDTGGIETSSERALQGQSPYALNVQLGWAHPERVSSITALVNLVGPRITEVGALGAPDAIEQPGAQVSLIGRVDLGTGWGLSIKGQNLLNTPTIRRQGGIVTAREVDGVGFGLGVSKRFGQ
ncbi:MAG: hypothetical protein ACI855_001932 [Myxococcota bacterium]|jgi:hypothetical protein